MRRIHLLFMVAAFLPLLALTQSAHATQRPPHQAVEFARIQIECVPTRALTFGPGKRWGSCRLAAAGFVGTIGLIDYYYAHYCLSAAGERCDHVAQLVFANRAYFPEATLQFVRLDAARTKYTHAQMVGEDGAYAIASIARGPGKPETRRYHAWDGSRWLVVSEGRWRRLLAQEMVRRLPDGYRARLPAQVMPDPERMALTLPLFKAGGGEVVGRAEVAVRIEGAHFVVAGVSLDWDNPPGP